MKFKVNSSVIQPRLREKARELKTVPPQAHKHFVGVTPIDKRRARKSTRLDGNTINANYPYATRLNNGWSRQARQGMWNPTLKFIKNLVKKILG